MFTIGTGVGGGLILDGRLYRGSTGAAAELGHTVVAAGGEQCACGARGCLEQYASGRALERYHGSDLSGVEVGRLALSGDRAARAIGG
jgi:glucokinase